jgi:hypothetical protein
LNFEGRRAASNIKNNSRKPSLKSPHQKEICGGFRLLFGVPYKPENDYEFLDQKRKRKVQEMKKLIHKFDIKTNELGLLLNGL